MQLGIFLNQNYSSGNKTLQISEPKSLQSETNGGTSAAGKSRVRWQTCAAAAAAAAAAATDLGVPLNVPLSPYEIICFRSVFMCLWFWACALFF